MRNFIESSSQPSDDNIGLNQEATTEINFSEIATDNMDSEDKLAAAYKRFFGDGIVVESTYL